MLHFFNAMDRDVEIVIRKKPRSRKGGSDCGGGGSAVCGVAAAELRSAWTGEGARPDTNPVPTLTPSPHRHLCELKLNYA